MNAQIEKEMSEASLMENANKAINVIIRPPRTIYQLQDLTNIIFDSKMPSIPRIPISFKNRRGVNLVGSFYISGQFNTEEKHYCVVYLHGNVGSQKEGRFLVKYLAPRGICVYCFDFSGSGLSGGEYVTLGFNEQTDIIDSLDFLRNHFHVAAFVLWGRSMGAASAVMAAPNHPLIKGIIVDSAYSSLSKLFSSIATQTPLPSFIRPMAVWWIKHEVQSRAGFDCNDVSPIDIAPKCTNVPLMLGHCTDDDFVPYKHGLAIFQKYGCPDKEMMTMTGGHNGARDPGWIMKCVRFILRVFGLPFQYFEVEFTPETAEHVASFADLLAAEGKTVSAFSNLKQKYLPLNPSQSQKVEPKPQTSADESSQSQSEQEIPLKAEKQSSDQLMDNQIESSQEENDQTEHHQEEQHMLEKVQVQSDQQ
ncbi:hypothetical protein M9Y10_011884 [Tritrichomonas musculus]|uniref:AB hydrolase-1 domain-containing protein n=1 Tax=Tritrichomonas musculus TaxID=1915356 RepID=A0ABR2IB47_9EUKA